MTWLKRCASGLLLAALLAGCASQPSAPKPEDARSTLPAAAVAAFEQGLAHLRGQRHAEAARAFERLTGEFPDYAGGWANLGVAYAELGREQDALRVWNEALTREPQHPLAGNRLAVLHREAGRFGEARTLYEGVLKAHPDYAPAQLNLGILCDLYLRDLNCARDSYQRYLALVGDDTQVANWLLDLERRLEKAK